MSKPPLVFQSSQSRPEHVTGRMRYYMADVETGAGEPLTGRGVDLRHARPVPGASILTAAPDGPSPEDLGEFYARGHGLSRGEAVEAILRGSLYPHARLLRRLMLVLDPDYFAVDRDYVSSVAALRHRCDLSVETDVFFDQIENRRFLRRVLRLRISGRRVHALVKQWWRAQGGGR